MTDKIDLTNINNNHLCRDFFSSSNCKITLIALGILGLGLGVGVGIYFGGQHLGISALKSIKNRLITASIVGGGLTLVLGAIASVIANKKKSHSESRPPQHVPTVEERINPLKPQIEEILKSLHQNEISDEKRAEVEKNLKTIITDLMQHLSSNERPACYICIFNLMVAASPLNLKTRFEEFDTTNIDMSDDSAIESLVSELCYAFADIEQVQDRLEKLLKDMTLRKIVGDCKQHLHSVPNPFTLDRNPTLDELQTYFERIVEFVLKENRNLGNGECLKKPKYCFYAPVLWILYESFNANISLQVAKSRAEFIYSSNFMLTYSDEIEPEIFEERGVYRLALFFEAKFRNPPKEGTDNLGWNIAAEFAAEARKYTGSQV